ncbi:hypothetical protein RF55_15051 [Lasius niger]|uniref:Uncharacterized protein n=1 Tax=Lasius niger TaxID=67767 RepID=A0A0J7K7D1_LASNI|nr:hypothetical protein RF55_15051 [Lasius niger]
MVTFWPKFPTVRRWADSLNISEEDTFNLNSLFKLNNEPTESYEPAYTQEWVCKHEKLWDRWPGKLEGLRPRDLDNHAVAKLIPYLEEKQPPKTKKK